MIYWLLLAAAVLHVAEEYFYDWVGWVRIHSPFETVTLARFAVVNALFLVLMFLSALYGDRFPAFGLSTATLLFVNAWFHIFPAIRTGKYMPGLTTAVMLYLPLSGIAYLNVWVVGSGWGILCFAFGLGMAWMSVPIFYQVLNGRGKRKRSFK